MIMSAAKYMVVPPEGTDRHADPQTKISIHDVSNKWILSLICNSL